MSLFLGIDPGTSGAWAVIDDDSKIIAYGQGKAMDGDFLVWAFQDDVYKGQNFRPISAAYLENQGMRHSDKGGKQFHIQKLLVNFGVWQGIMNALDIPFKLIAPMTWMSRWGCAGRMPSNLRKKAYLAVARRLWPDRKFKEGDHDLAVALLLAELARVDYGREGLCKT